MDICVEATQELQSWIADYIQKNKASLTSWLDLPTFEMLLSESKNITVDWREFKAQIPTTTKLFLEMEIGSRRMPQFKIITSMNFFLESIHGKYEKEREGYLLATLLR